MQGLQIQGQELSSSIDPLQLASYIMHVMLSAMLVCHYMKINCCKDGDVCNSAFSNTSKQAQGVGFCSCLQLSSTKGKGPCNSAKAEKSLVFLIHRGHLGKENIQTPMSAHCICVR